MIAIDNEGRGGCLITFYKRHKVRHGVQEHQLIELNVGAVGGI
jgi:hypothetical protein